MKLLLSGLLLTSLCALSSWSVSSGTLVVTQTPDATVTEGETVNITCCWTKKSDRLTVNWLKNETEIVKGYFQNGISNCSSLIRANVTRMDSGTYVCKVTMEIPIYAWVKGNGTVITVTTRDNADDHRDDGENKESTSRSLPVQVALAVVAPLLLITLVWFCCLRRKQAQVARVIYEVPHSDSETQDLDKHSTSSSRGSSQWCQVPVYESFDYFEHVETKKSG